MVLVSDLALIGPIAARFGPECLWAADSSESHYGRVLNQIRRRLNHCRRERVTWAVAGGAHCSKQHHTAVVRSGDTSPHPQIMLVNLNNAWMHGSTSPGVIKH